MVHSKGGSCTEPQCSEDASPACHCVQQSRWNSIGVVRFLAVIGLFLEDYEFRKEEEDT